MNKNNKAFSLVELSVVLTIIGITLAGALDLATRKTEAERIEETNDRITAIQQAIEMFIVTYQRIPCPADAEVALTSSDAGVEKKNGTPAVCTKNLNSSNVWSGAVPTKTLGLADKYMVDDWDRRFTYIVDYRFANNKDDTNSSCDGTTSTVCFRQTSAGSITVNDSTGATRTTEAVYAIISYGKNGLGAWKSVGSATPMPSPTDSDEIENAEGTGSFDTIFVQKDSTTTFDDIVSYKLKSELIEDVDGVTDADSCYAADSPSCSGEGGTTCTDLAAREKKWCLQP